MEKRLFKCIGILFSASFFSITFFQCHSQKATNDVSFQSIENYFAKRGWDFPICITDTTLSLKYYRNKNGIVKAPRTLENDIQKIKKIYQRQYYGKELLKSTLIVPEKQPTFGYKVSQPTIYIDTSDYGSKFNPKIFLAFLISKYKINNDSLSLGLPCENCIPEEKNKILRYPNGIFFELNKSEDSLILSRWD